MSKHTPGPWTASIGSKGARIHIGNDVNHPLSFGFNWSEYDADLSAEAIANAQLIAAAPDLLKAAKWVRNQVRHAERSDVDFEEKLGIALIGFTQLEAAIAKAEGAPVHV